MSTEQLTLPANQVQLDRLLELRAKLFPPYKLILFNDDYNEMHYIVAALLHVIANLSEQEAERIMLTAHLTGSAVVVVCPREIAEHYQERLISYGLTATIEPD